MRNNLSAIMATMFGKVKKETAKQRRVKKDRRVTVAPRSMTPEEKEYYDKHKNLTHFYRGQ